jgi:DNA topoisomerase-2
MLFPKDDDLILEQLVSSDMKVQPKFFIPLLPLVLVNGAEGLATGHSCFIYPYDPAQLKDAVLKVIDGKKLKKGSLVPHFNGFNGAVERTADGQVVCYGKYELKTGRKPQLIISELPIGMSSESYKTHLHALEDKGKIVGFDNLSDKNGFDFRIQLPPDFSMTDEEILKTFKLISRETENLTLWDKDGFIKRFDTVEDIIVEWTDWRLEQAERRRQALISKINADIEWANQKVKFIRYYLVNTKLFKETPNKTLIPILVQEGFSRHDELLAMPMRNLTHDKIKELEEDVKKLQATLVEVQSETAQSILKRDLKAIKL